MLDELPALIAAGYEQMPEEDIVRLKWWGLYHDKPKIGTFMLRVKIPGGIVTPPQLRAIGEISNVHGRGEGELTTRQNVQLHYLELKRCPTSSTGCTQPGLTSAGACGDTVRNITGCPVAGLAHDELFDPTPVLEEAAALFYGNPDYSDLPRKHKIAITACADALRGARDQLRRPRRRAARRRRGLRRARRRRALVGAADRPRARHLGAEGRRGDRARRDPRRVARRPPLPRLAGEGAAQVHDRRHRPRRHARTVEAAARPSLRRLRAAAAPAAGQPSRCPRAARRPLLRRRARAPRARHGRPDDRARPSSATRSAAFTRQQNLVLVGDVDARRPLAEIGLPLDAGALRGDAIACTGEPHCNFSVTETKSRMDGLVQLLEDRFGKTLDGLRLHLDGCPHACAQHWVGDLGFQGTTVRDEEGKRRQAYDVYLRGSLDRPAAIARPGVPARADRGARRRRLGLVGGWVDGARRRRDVPHVLRPHYRRRSLPAELAREEETAMSVELLDDLEAGELRVEFEGEEPEVVLEWAIERFSPSIAISTAFQTDGAVLLHMAYEIDPRSAVQRRHGPAAAGDVRADRADARALPAAAARPALARRRAGRTRWSASTARTSSTGASRTGSSAARCARSAAAAHLAGLDAWITGLRRDQWATRSDIRKVEIDHDHGAIVKLNPLAEWSEDEVWDYVREHDLPYNPLYDKGYTSIGCAPCTRATAGGRGRARRSLVVGDERAEGMRHPLRDRDRRPRARAARADRARR